MNINILRLSLKPIYKNYREFRSKVERSYLEVFVETEYYDDNYETIKQKVICWNYCHCNSGEWEVDPIVDKQKVIEWIDKHIINPKQCINYEI